MAFELNCAIIGGGVVGLATAAEISARHPSTFLFERHATFGTETSSRNSEVIHAGIHYPPGSLKARLCVEGRRLLYELGSRRGIPHSRIGKIIIARTQSDMALLERLRDQGRENGVEDLSLLSARKVKELEPNVRAAGGLLSPSTGIVSAHGLMEFLYQRARGNGADFLFGAEVIGIERTGSAYNVRVRDSEGIAEIRARAVINAAGLSSDRVAELAGIAADQAGYRLHYCKGNYASLSPRCGGRVSRLIYPPPEKAGLGVHLTIGLDGRMRLGPDTRYVESLDYRVDRGIEADFFSAARPFLPFLQPQDVRPDFAGIRPKLQGPDDPFRDFVIAHEDGRGLPGLINLVGIESPGLTASPAIGRMVAGMVMEILG